MVWPSRYGSRAAAQFAGAAGRAAAFVRRLHDLLAASDDQHPSSRTARLASYALLGALVGVLVIVAAATVPGLFGYHTYDVRGGSMKPTIQNGSVVVTKATRPADLEVGDVIARPSREDGTPILHRVVEITMVDGERYFVTQGDANQTPDATPALLRGPGDKVVYSVPYAGYVVRYAGGGTGRFLLIVVPLTLLALLLLRERWRGLPAPASAADAGPSPALRAPGPDLAPMPAPPASNSAALDAGAGEAEQRPVADVADEAAAASANKPRSSEPEPQALPETSEPPAEPAVEAAPADATPEPTPANKPRSSEPEPQALPETSEPPAEPTVEAAPADATPEPTPFSQPLRSEPDPQALPEAREDETEETGAGPDSSYDPLPPLKLTRRRRQVPDIPAPDLPNFLEDQSARRRRPSSGPPSRTEEEGG